MYGIITARGGSKSIKRKNLIDLNGKPLIFYTINEALKSNLDKIFLTTDDDEIIEYASSFNIEIIKRPDYLANDNSKSIDVIKHVFEVLNRNSEDFCLLQPTSPFRTYEHINESISFYKSDISSIKSLVSVVELDHNYNPESLMKVDKNGYLNYIKENSVFRRQDKPVYYARNGAAIYIFNSKDIKDKLLNGNILKYVMKKKHSIDIDSYEDLELAEILMKYHTN